LQCSRPPPRRPRRRSSLAISDAASAQQSPRHLAVDAASLMMAQVGDREAEAIYHGIAQGSFEGLQ
jgi:hypothetical protein